MSNIQVYDFIENIDCAAVHALMLLHPRNKCIHAQTEWVTEKCSMHFLHIRHPEKSATASISVLPNRLTILKKHRGLAIAYGHAYAAGAWMRKSVFSYVKRTGKTNLNAA